MAVRLIKNIRPSLWHFTSLNLKRDIIRKVHEGIPNNYLPKQICSPIVNKGIESSLKVNWGLLSNELNASSYQGNKSIDLFTNNVHKRLYMPTITINTLKVYQDVNNLSKSIEDNRKIIKIIDEPGRGTVHEKKAIRMIRIRRRKMKKHQRKKLRKKMKFIIAKIKLKRELKKEQLFRSELLTQVEAAENFDAKEYVDKILHTLRYHPKPETEAEKREKYRLKMKAHRYQTNYIRPNFSED